MTSDQVMLTEDMLKDCDKNFLENSSLEEESVKITPPVDNNKNVDFIQMMDQIKFLTTKLTERDREINFLKQDLDRTLDVSLSKIIYFLKIYTTQRFS